MMGVCRGCGEATGESFGGVPTCVNSECQHWLAEWVPRRRPTCLQRDKISGLYRGDTIHTLRKQAREAKRAAEYRSWKRNQERIEEAKAKVEEARNRRKVKRPKIGTHRRPQNAEVSSRGGDTT